MSEELCDHCGRDAHPVVTPTLDTLYQRVIEAEDDLMHAVEAWLHAEDHHADDHDMDMVAFDDLLEARSHYTWVSALQHAEEIKTGNAWWSDSLDARAYLDALKVIVAHLAEVTSEAA